ncbi:hypothetical protein N602_27495 [Mycobacterium avium subsp. hominissuis 10-5606]|nr:hypothetical protein N602_27495 [Mycobacterium avium subsp. hominissuis 10-5606]
MPFFANFDPDAAVPPAARRDRPRSWASSARSISHCNDRRDIGVNPHCESNCRISAAKFLHTFALVSGDQNSCISFAARYIVSTSESVHSGTIGDDHARRHHACTCGYQSGPSGNAGIVGFFTGFNTARVDVLLRRARTDGSFG